MLVPVVRYKKIFYQFNCGHQQACTSNIVLRIQYPEIMVANQELDESTHVRVRNLCTNFIQCYSFLGFDEVLDILERLTPLDFCLPEDLAIRHLTRANEAFGDNY